MTYAEAFDLVDSGEGQWDVQRHGTFIVAGQLWRTRAGFLLSDWLDRQVGIFGSIEDALRALVRIECDANAHIAGFAR